VSAWHGRNRYTAEQDAAILASRSADELKDLSVRLRRSYETIRKRRTALRHYASEERVREFNRLGPFARPTWFSEDLAQMTRGATTLTR